MAKDEETKEEATEASGGGKKKLIIIIAAVVLLAGGGAAAFMTMGGGKEDAEAAVEEVVAEVAINLELDPFLVNLADPGGSHYLRTTLTLEMDSQEAVDWVNGHLPKVRDKMLMYLSSKSSEELLSSQGKIALREIVMEKLNAMMDNGRVSAVYLTEFMVQ